MRRRFPRLDPRHRFRDRLLLVMMLVALVPLAVFLIAVTADLGGISRRTVDQTHQTIVEDQMARQQSQVTDRARTLDTRLGAIAAAVAGLGDAYNAAAGKLPATPPPPRVFSQDSGAWYAGAAPPVPGREDSTLILAAGSPLIPLAADARQNGMVGADSLGLVPLMESLRKNYPEVSGVWLADRAEGLVRTVPWMDAQRAIDTKRVDPQNPLGPNGDTVFSTSVQRMGAATGGELWTDPDVPSRHATAGPFWTDPYVTHENGSSGVTVWIPAAGGRLYAGADITLADLAAQIPGDASTEPGSYPILLSSSDTVLSAPAHIAHDFNFPPTTGDATSWLGAQLPLGGNGTLAGAERTGRTQPIQLSLAGVDKVIFTAPIYGPHWLLATVVPAADLEPDAAALQRGVETGLRSILLQAIPVVLILVALAFVLASLFARRLVVPVGALTRAAERLGDGHTDEPVPEQGSDEVGQLATSLEHMRQEVNTSRDAILAASRELEVRVADRTAELRMRNEELLALNALAASLTRSLDVTIILQEALETVEAVLALRAACGYTASRDGDDLAARAWLGTARAHAGELRRVAAAALDEQALVQRPDGAHGVLLGIPLVTHDGAVGALAVVARDRDVVERSLPLLNAIADQVALALRTAELSEEGRNLAVLEERTRLAREIHDTLAQQLTGIVLQLEAAEAFVGRDPGDARNVIVGAREQARSALQEARRSVWNLRPAPLAATGLVAALGLEVQRWSERTGITARLRTDSVSGPLPLQPQGEVALLRILQEALSNTARHAGAQCVEVSLRLHAGVLELQVADDGTGFEVATERQPGSFGLLGMQERARLAGAELTVESTPGTGTRVCVRLALDTAPAIPA